MKDRLFGTNGIRGVVNEFLNAQFACNLGMAIGTFLKGGRVGIGTDTRTSGDMFKSAVVSGLLATGCEVLDFGVAPTPTVQFGVRRWKCRHGVVITASHNPPQFNGIKCIDTDGTELSREKEERIERLYFSGKFHHAKWDEMGDFSRRDIVSDYISAIASQVDIVSIRNAALKVVLDCGNGAGSTVSPYLLERLGCSVVTLNAHPQGTFPGHASEPTLENLNDLALTVKALGADIGIAHDGDADRAIFIDEKGNFIHGDRTLALVAKHMVKENNGGLVVTPVATSMCLEETINPYGGRVEYTKVGSPIVARRMMETEAVFGGEENGGLIFPRHQYCRYGPMTAAKIVEILAKEKRDFSMLISELPQYSLYKTKISCPEEKKETVLSKLAEECKDKEVCRIDGMKISSEDGWVLIRPSGTEQIYRIFAESRNMEKAKQMAEEQVAKVKKLIESC